MGGLELGRFQDGLSSFHHQIERCDRVYRVCLCWRHRTRRILALEWVFLIARRSGSLHRRAFPWTARARRHRGARVQFRALNEPWRTVVKRLPRVRVTLAFSALGIAPHSDSHQEASRLRLIRDGAFAASDHRSVEKFGSCECLDFLRFHHQDTCRVPAPRPKIHRQRDEWYNPKTQRERPPDS